MTRTPKKIKTAKQNRGRRGRKRAGCQSSRPLFISTNRISCPPARATIAGMANPLRRILNYALGTAPPQAVANPVQAVPLQPAPGSPRETSERSGDDPRSPVGPASPQDTEARLVDFVTSSYRPSMPIYSFTQDQVQPWQFYTDVDSMVKSAYCSTPLRHVCWPAATAKTEFEASSPVVKKFLESEFERFWTYCLSKVQMPARSYGWMGGECVYTIERRVMVLKDLLPFESKDVQPLRKNNVFVGIRAKGGAIHEQLDLWAATGIVPAKGFWYCHQAKRGSLFGDSDLYAAWRPWRRLTGRDGVEEISDLCAYRSGAGFIVNAGFPGEDHKAKFGAPTTSPPA